MKKAYRFDDDIPMRGSSVYAIRTLKGLKDFASINGDSGNYRFWEISGDFVDDDGTEDGIVIKVVSVKEIFI
jgi:hypothetical protein